MDFNQHNKIPVSFTFLVFLLALIVCSNKRYLHFCPVSLNINMKWYAQISLFRRNQTKRKLCMQRYNNNNKWWKKTLKFDFIVNANICALAASTCLSVFCHHCAFHFRSFQIINVWYTYINIKLSFLHHTIPGHIFVSVFVCLIWFLFCF